MQALPSKGQGGDFEVIIQLPHPSLPYKGRFFHIRLQVLVFHIEAVLPEY